MYSGQRFSEDNASKGAWSGKKGSSGKVALIAPESFEGIIGRKPVFYQ